MRVLKRKEQGNALMIAAVTAAAVTSAVAYGIAKMHQVQFAALEKSKKQLNAFQLANDRADVIRATIYSGISELQRTKIGETDYYEQVSVSESDGVKTCTISVFDSSNSVSPVAQLVVKRKNPGTVQMNLYDELGQNSDGAMTQKAVTDALENVGGGCQIGTCATAAATGAKVVTVSGNFVLKEGAMVGVKFTYPPTAFSTLNVNGTGAKTIRLLDTLNYSASGSAGASGNFVSGGSGDIWGGSGSRSGHSRYNVSLKGTGTLTGSSSLSSSVTNSGYAFALFVYDGSVWNLVGNSFARGINTNLNGGYGVSGSVSLSVYANYSNYSNRCTCFGKDSLVLCVDKEGRYFEKPIQFMKQGDRVVGANGEINTVKAVDNPDFGLFLGDKRTLMQLECEGSVIQFTSEHEFYVRQKGITNWGTHDRSANEYEYVPSEDGSKSVLDAYYEKICKAQGIDYYKDIGISHYEDNIDEILDINESAEYLRYDGKYHKVKVSVVESAKADCPLYHILMDGNHSYWVNGFLVSSCQYVPDIDWATYVKPIRLVKRV